jgi:glutamate dehydrogenase
VNIKILFAPLLAAGTTTREARNSMLVSCEEEVVQAVLANNRGQSRMVSFDVEQSKGDVFRYARTLRYLAQRVPFNPEAFSLPTDDELQNRTRKGQGMYKCEAAVLCSHAKMLAYRELLEGQPLPADIVEQFVNAYFPRGVLELAGREAVGNHLLRREIATTMIINHIVDNMGGTFLTDVGIGTLIPTADITVAYLRAAAAADLPAIQEQLYRLEDKRSMKAVYEAMAFIRQSLEEATFYLLDQMDLPAVDERSITEVKALLANVDEALPSGSRSLTPVLDAVRLAPTLGKSAKDTLFLRLSVTDAIHFNDLNQAIDRMVLSSPWDGPGVSAMRRQLNFHVHKLVRMVEGGDVPAMIERYGLRQFAAQVRAQAESTPTVSGLVMLDDWLRRLLPPLASLRQAAE